MRLVYAVVDNPDRMTPTIKMVLDAPPSLLKINSDQEDRFKWNNGYSIGYYAIGSRARWWGGYREGTVVGVYDTDNLKHLQNLANLMLGITDDARLNSMPSRESSI